VETTYTLVTLLELARTVRVPAAWLKAEAVAGRIPSLSAGRRRLFNLEAVVRVLAERAAIETVVVARSRRCAQGAGGTDAR
jgi:hypothetical protein